jgi:hypothetical protein
VFNACLKPENNRDDIRPNIPAAHPYQPFTDEA